jgi:hypothetical protein
MNMPIRNEPIKVPDILLSGEAVSNILMALNNAIVFVKAQDGSMRPFVDPGPIHNVIQEAIQTALRPPGG